jgi:threonine-phosphate decarboxylase
MRPVHGGHADPALLDLSASIAPLGPPPSVRAVLADAGRIIARYPDIDARPLCAAAAAHHSVPECAVLVGNGTAELIYLIAHVLRGKRVHLVRPCFAEYEAACRAMDATVVEDPAAADATFAANPESPRGTLMAAASLRARPGLRVIDEAFMGFTDERESLAREAADDPQMIVLRSLTKTYCLPGLRVGYLVAHPSLVTRLRAVQPPWSTNGLAIAAGVAALSDTSHLAQVRGYVAVQRAWLRCALLELGYEALDGRASFLLCRVRSATDVCKRLLDRGIVVRDCTSFTGLEPDRYVRIAVGSCEDHARLIAALREIGP